MGYDKQADRLDDLMVPSGHKLYEIIKSMKLSNIKYRIMLSQWERRKLRIVSFRAHIGGFIKLQAPEFPSGSTIT